jgi:hypothetical protein
VRQGLGRPVALCGSGIGLVLLVGLTAPAAAGMTAAAALTGAVADPVRVVTVRDARITESSGLALSPTHPDLVWTVDDSGTGPVVYGVSTRTGSTRAALRLVQTEAGGDDAAATGAVELRDPEALAAGRDPGAGPGGDARGDTAGRGLLWVGDIGDNIGARRDVVLHLVREPTVIRPDSQVSVVSLRVRYPSGPADAEALLWTPDGRLLIITKAVPVGRALEVPPSAVRQVLAGRSVTRPVTAVRIGTVPQTLVTDATALPDGRIVVRDYGGAVLYQLSGSGFADAGSLDLPDQPQGETIAAEPGGRTVLVGSEGRRQPLWRVEVPGAASGSATTTPSATRPGGTGGGSSPAGQTPLTEPPRGPAPRDGRLALAAAAAALMAVVAGAALRAGRRRGRRTG